MSFVLKMSLLAFFSAFSMFLQANEVNQPLEAAKTVEHPFKRILIIHSYDPSYQWTRDLQNGIDKALSLASTPVKVSVEYLDTKRINTNDYYQELERYFRVKYNAYPFDAVIATDDNAVRLLNKTNIIPNRTIPIIAVGINDLSARLDSVSDYTATLYERDNVEGNISEIIKLRKDIKNIYYLSDRSTTSELIRNKALPIISNLPDVNLVEVRDQTLNAAGDLLSTVSPDDAVILTHFNTELDKGIYHTYENISSVIGKKSAAPVFVFWDFYIINGILGGYVNHSENMGVEAVQALDQYIPMNFTKALSFPNVNLLTFDYEVMIKFGIEQELLPKSVVILNKPKSFLEDNFRLLLGAGIIIISLFLVIITQSVMLRQKRELAKKNSKILSLQKRTVGVQKEMIHVLGEAIETRSGETGNHVKRVAMLSALLAKLKGLSHREIEIIEIISPMHDVGKIAVPEAILDKPGKLTASEWKIMQQHTTVGFNLLKTSNGDLTNLAAIIANEHHERWDGNGYPQQKSGTNIHIFARITAIADVFDALLSQRCYKDAWPIERVVAWFEAEQGLQFDPDLTTLLLENIEEFVKIRNTYPDANSQIVNAA